MAKFFSLFIIVYVLYELSADKICSDPNEEYKSNIKKCEKDLCSSIVSKFACDPKDEGQLGCFCKPGFLRLTENSSCVPTKQCPELANSPDYQNSGCGVNEIMNNCPLEKCEYCPTCDKDARACLSATQDSCPPPKCMCRNNYRRLQNGTCIPTRECPPIHCPRENEKFEQCPLCANDDCSRATVNGGCKVIGRIGTPLQCRPSCRCIKNYWRDGDRCVPYESCPNIQKKVECVLPNESLKCVKKCPPSKTCKNRHIQFSCFNNETEMCEQKCVCNAGFFRNEDGYCVTGNLCNKNCTGPNEVYTPAKKNCSPDICKSIISRYACDPIEKGQPGCVCKSGFLRLTLNSTCIPMEKCPELADSPDYHKPICNLPNESLKCLKKCPPPKTCKNRNLQVRCLYNESEVCKDQCICNNGFYRNEDGYCVTSNLCDKNCTGPNEIYKPNKKSCPPEICQSKLALYKCDSKEKSQPGCVCKPGYLRLNLNSSCIPSEECPESKNMTEHLKCTGPNESLQCVKSCPPLKTCKNHNKVYHCPMFNSSTPCKTVCACNKGFYRNSDGFCVTSELCDKNCTGHNEVYIPDKKNCSPDICKSIVSRYACDSNEKGQPGCVCKSGFLRLTLNSTCIPMEQCPELANSPDYHKCTKPNESLKCVKSCPRPQTCIGRHIRYKCFNTTNETCKNECVCDDGFYRNPDGFCVTSNLCDKKCTGLHEEYKPDKKLCAPDICRSLSINYQCGPDEHGHPGCVCQKGFLRINLNSPCIPKEQCPEYKPDYSGTCADSNEDTDTSYEKSPVKFDVEYWLVIDATPKKQIDEDALAST